MENSSSSKTRSPARVLAALLAVVMLFIVMPVLPAGADEPVLVKKITLLDMPKNENGDYVIFDPSDSSGERTIHDVTSDQENFTWGKLTNAHAKLDGNNVVITRGVSDPDKDELGFTNSYRGTGSFTFALFVAAPGLSVYWSTLPNGSTWYPLDSTSTTDDGCNIYTIPQGDMQGPDIYIKVAQAYTVTFSIADGAGVQAGTSAGSLKEVYSSGNVTVMSGETLYFTAETSETGYQPKVSVPKDLTANLIEGKYQVTGINRNITVTVTLEKKQYTVTPPEAVEGYTVSVMTPSVGYNEPATFSVETTEGYQEPTVTIKSGDAALQSNQYAVTKTGSTSTYTIPHVTNNITIEISDTGEKTYTVEFIIGDGVKVEKQLLDSKDSFAGTATYNQKLSFAVKAESGWKLTKPFVTINGVQVSGKQGEGEWTYEYTVTSDTHVSISSFEREVYTVTIQNTDKYTVDGSYNVSVPFEGDYTFTLTLADAYKATAENGLITAKFTKGTDAEDVTVVKSEGRDGSYTVTVKSVKKSFTLSFDGIGQKTYKVEIKDANGDSAVGYSVKENGSFNEVKHGDGVSFTITLEDGYKIDNVSIYVTGGNDVALASVMADNGKGTYSISSVTNNYTVKVSVSAIPFVITIQSSPATTLGSEKSPMNSTVVTKRYTAADEDVTIEHDAANGTYTLMLPKATRPGYKLVGWNNNDGTEIENGTLTFYEGTAYTATVIAEWKINTELGQDGVVPFVQLQLTRTYEGEKDVLKVEHIASNIDANDVGETVTLRSHGILYGITKNALDDFGKKVEAGEITYEKFMTGSSSGSLSELKGLDSVFYSWHDDSNKETVDLLKQGHTYTETVGNAKKLQGCAVAYVVVTIGDETYLFYSQVKFWTDNEG